ncbi:MAG TPA: hypothetical protein G4N97_11185 [Thermoflexia bacterium]|nr:hypothetical protein [Thermoflexia bacterium]
MTLSSKPHHSTAKRTRGGIAAALVTALLFVILVAIPSIASHSEAVRPSQERASLRDVLSAPGCFIPAAAVTFLALTVSLIGLYYAKQRLDAQVRIWRARAAEAETDVEHLRVRLNDLTPGPDGQEVARILQTPDGRLVLVNARIAASPITLLDPEAAARPDQTPDPLQLAAILGNALRGVTWGSGPGGGRRPQGSGGPSPLDGLALLALTGMRLGFLDQSRVPDRVRVLDDEEVELLEEGRKEE